MAFAAQPGAFIGGTLGYSMLHISDDDSDAIKKNGFAYGIQGGYNFDQNFGIEGGYNQLHSIKVGDKSASIHDIDILADGYLPIANNIDLVGKAGLTRIKASVTNGESNSATKTKPKIAFGINYTLQKNMSLQASYSRILASEEGINAIDMLGLSFNYSFGGAPVNNTNCSCNT